MPPKVGGYIHSTLMYPAAMRAAAQIRRKFEFDLIDSHFVFPDGVLATTMAKRLGKPVVITGRGEDILRFPKFPLIGRQIRRALARADALVALSQEIAEAMIANGADADKITVIPNGVDCTKFQPIDRDEARRGLNLPTDRPVVLSVGYRLERKGFHLLVDAIPGIRERFPNVLVVIVGGQARWSQDYTSVIEERIRANNVADSIYLAGPRPPEELSKWYSAADQFVLLSSREGSPNVLMEALACGLPSVATPVGGIPDVLSDPRLGILLPERSAQAAAVGISEALAREWDRKEIRRVMQKRNWQRTAEQVNDVFKRAASNFSSQAEKGRLHPVC
jgi:glycosyltransferase involved in cell wall biosynthesis